MSSWLCAAAFIIAILTLTIIIFVLCIIEVKEASSPSLRTLSIMGWIRMSIRDPQPWGVLVLIRDKLLVAVLVHVPSVHTLWRITVPIVLSIHISEVTTVWTIWFCWYHLLWVWIFSWFLSTFISAPATSRLLLTTLEGVDLNVVLIFFASFMLVGFVMIRWYGCLTSTRRWSLPLLFLFLFKCG